MARLKNEFERIKALSPEDATKESPLRIQSFTGTGTPQKYYDLNRSYFSLFNNAPDEKRVKAIIQSLDNEGRWLVKHASVSNPYSGDGVNKELTDEFASKNVGDETDTSGFSDPSDQLYISTSEYIRNMNLLINYLKSCNDK